MTATLAPGAAARDARHARARSGLLRPFSGARLADTLLIAGVALLFAISPSVLYRLGIHYEAPGGNPLGKFHPGTLVVLAGLAVRLLHEGPDRAIGRFVSRCPGAAAFAAIWAFAVLYIVATIQVPVTPVLETFLLPLALFAAIAIRGAPPQALAWLIHAAFLANALIGLGEFASGHRLTPLMAATIEIKDDWRSSALLGHPLSNATMTATYIAVLAFGGGEVRPRLRLALIGLQLLALAVFGGRAALVLTLALLALFGAGQLLRFLGGRRVRLSDLAVIALALPLAAMTLGLLAEAGFFDLLLERFVSDNGSAQTRIVMFRLFDALSTQDLLFGPDPALIATIVQREGLEFGIESFPVAFVLLYGAVLTAMFFAGLAGFCLDLVRATRPATALVLALFFVVCATSLSLAGKTTILGLAIITCLALMRPPRPQAPPAKGTAP